MLPVKAEATALYLQEALRVYKDLELNQVNGAYPYKRSENMDAFATSEVTRAMYTCISEDRGRNDWYRVLWSR